MEIRENPYEDLDVGDDRVDRTVEMADMPFADEFDQKLQTKQSGKRDASPLVLKLSGVEQQPQSIQKLGIQLEQNRTDKTKIGMPSLAKQKHTINKLGIPALDLSGLKNVKEYKDWYGYSQKLENCIRLLREKTEGQEKKIDMQHLQLMKQETQIENLTAKIK